MRNKEENRAIISLNEYEALKEFKQKYIHLEKKGSILTVFSSTNKDGYNEYTELLFCKDEENELKKALDIQKQTNEAFRDELAEVYTKNHKLRKRNLIQRILNK